MKLVFAVDAIFPPLTGIGRYAWELASGLGRHASCKDTVFFNYGRFVPNPAQLETQPVTQSGVSAALPLAARLRTRLALSHTAVKLYGAASPLLYRWRLRHLCDHLYHSPNYFLPPFGGPSVATIHDLSWLRYPQFHPAARVALMNAELPKTLKRASHLITDSESIRQEVISQLGWSPERVSAIALGVDALFQPHTPEQTHAVLSAYGLAHGAYTLCVATIEPRKNLERLIAAHQALPRSLRLQYPLVLVGAAGWNSQALHERIAALQGPGLRYLDYVPQQHLYALYAGARLFAFPSLYEGFGLPVLEAMASGCPVLISRNTCLTEVGGDAAWQVDPLEVDSIREGLVHALQDTQWRAQACDRGLQAAAKLSWNRCFEETLALYHRLQPVTP